MSFKGPLHFLPLIFLCSWCFLSTHSKTTSDQSIWNFSFSVVLNAEAGTSVELLCSETSGETMISCYSSDAGPSFLWKVVKESFASSHLIISSKYSVTSLQQQNSRLLETWADCIIVWMDTHTRLSRWSTLWTSCIPINKAVVYRSSNTTWNRALISPETKFNTNSTSLGCK